MITPGYSPTATERVLPRMALDFTTASLDSRVTVTRALNTATRTNSSGYLEIVNANLPRFDFSPTSVGTCRGLLIEESRANLVLQSSDFTTASWTKTDTTPTAASGTSPDGTNTATLLTQGSAATSEVWQSFVVGAGNTVTYSRYVKIGNAQWYMLQIRNGGATSFAYAFFDLTNGVVGSTSSSGGFATLSGSTITNVGNGWFRVTFTVMIGATFGTAVFASSSVTANGVATPVSGGTRYEWGCQAEVGAFATSYIPTTTTSLTRNADVVSMTGTNFSSWYNATEGALFVQATAEIPATDGNVRFAAAIYDTAAYANAFRLERLSGNCRVIKTVSGSSLVASYSWPIDITGSAIMAYKDSNSASSFRAATPGLYAGGVPSGMAYLGIGGSHVGSNVWCGHVQRVMYWPQRVINAETQAFTK